MLTDFAVLTPLPNYLFAEKRLVLSSSGEVLFISYLLSPEAGIQRQLGGRGQ